MCKQLELFPEITSKLTCSIDDLALDYIKDYAKKDGLDIEDIKKAFKDGALLVLSDVIDIIKKYTTVYEAQINLI